MSAPDRDESEMDLAQLERAMMSAFRDAPEASARPDDEARAAAAVRAVMMLSPRGRSVARRSRAPVVLLAAAAALVAAVGFAALRRGGGVDTSGDSQTSAVEGDIANAPEKPSSIANVEEKTNPEATADARATDEPTVAAGELPAVVSSGVKAAAAPTAAELFARATEARRADDVARAVATYEELQRRYPRSREASTSRVALGRLLLDRSGDAARARSAFEAYLAAEPNGALAEEARAGRAAALQKLGDTEAERAAWRDLITHHPSSVHVGRAQKRLEALGD